jgi:mono/diheme cytochrome c family protein
VVLVVLGTVLRVNQGHDIEAAAVDVPTDDESIARGRHIVESYALCVECHGENMEGRVIEEDFLFGTFAPPNLTSGLGGRGGELSDVDYVRAIRHGVGRDGKGLFIMPSQHYNKLSDEDVGAIIAYLKNLPPVDNDVELKLGPLARIISLFEADFFPARLIDHNAEREPSPARGVTAEYGEYLTTVCTLCHGEHYSGGTVPGEPDAPKAANLTVLTRAQWSEEDFIKVMRTGVNKSGKQIDPEYMPWDRFAKMTDDELKALWLFISSLEAREFEG